MLERLRVLGKRLSRKGFAGPKYQGMFGKLRFAAESLVARRELTFVLHPADFWAHGGDQSPAIDIIPITDFSALEQYREDLEARWYPGIIESWRGPWSWGERLFLGLDEGRPISFNWLQVGTPAGAPTYTGRVFDQEYRILRGGVAPECRGKGTNTQMKREIIRQLFVAGATRVYAECYEGNIPSIKTLRALGFRVTGCLDVLEVPGLRGFIRWREAPPTEG
jgi:RimJ/RimL family protein N-acetyltransferase